MNSFGQNLERLMRQQRVTISELARIVGVRPQTASEWKGKAGRIPRNPEHLKKICEALNVTVHYLLFGEEDPKQSISLAEITKEDFFSGNFEITVKRLKGKV